MAKTAQRTTKKTTKAKPVTKKKKATTVKAKKTDAKKAKEKEVTVDRRRKPRRTNKETVKEEVVVEKPALPKPERREKVQRRRQIDPTTCERDYTDEEIEFMHALDAYKRANGRMFPTCSEILEVIRGLGFERKTPEDSNQKENPVGENSDQEAAVAEQTVDSEGQPQNETLVPSIDPELNDNAPHVPLDDQLRSIESNSLFS